MLLKILKSSACRSNHHRLAIDALTQLRGTDGELWRNLFLHHYPDYLEGAKAPDEVFKDFKNHVLHVREGDWGGAPAAAREWYRRTVRALAQQDWKGAVYSAGVMSHYVVDPLQPFHTGQTEEEGIIHRAVEWSLSKSYDELQRILETDLGGYADVPVPAGNDWLEQMVKTGAKVFAVGPEVDLTYKVEWLGNDASLLAKLPEAVADKQLKERTELTHSRIGAPQRESILAAGLALQQAGVIDAKVDVKASVDALIDDQVPLPKS
jgi:hypothetical protein